jgi:hypothetical protein
MKRTLSLTLLVLLFSVQDQLQAQGNFGAGFIFGDPTGISWNYRLSRENAIDGGIGFSPFDRYRIHADYLWRATPFHDQRIGLHYGIGAIAGFGSTHYVTYQGRYAYVLRNEEIGFAARVPVGLSYQFPRSPVELVVELAPMVIFAPASGIGVDAGLGVRFYF